MGYTGVNVTDNPAYGRVKGESDISFFIRTRESYFLTGQEAPIARFRREVMAHSTTAEEFYMAVKVVDDGDFLPKGSVFGEVIVKSWSGRGDSREFAYKELWEGMGLGSYAGPSLKVLDALSAIEDMGIPDDTAESMRVWREGCRAFAARPKPKVGDTFLLPHAVPFGDGVSRSLFTVGANGKLTDALRGTRVRVPKWRDMLYTLITDETRDAAIAEEVSRRAAATRDRQLARLFRSEHANHASLVDEARRKGAEMPLAPTYASLHDSWAQMPGDIRDDLSPYLEDAEVEAHLVANGDALLPGS